MNLTPFCSVVSRTCPEDKQMSLSLTDLQGDLREYFSRIEEVLSGMDAVLTQLENRVARLEGRSGAASAVGGTEERLARLEGQMAAIAQSLFDGPSDGPQGSIIVRG